jgi:hypothetical protein
MLAALWSASLIVAAFFAPAYRGVTTSVPCAGCQPVIEQESRTLVEMNGLGVLIPVALPLATSGAVAAFLARARGSGRSALFAAWAAVGLLGLFALLALFSIGMFVVPTVLLLALATFASANSPDARSAA